MVKKGNKDEDLKTVMIVDDAKFMRNMIENILTVNGFEVIEEARTGEEAVQKYKNLMEDNTTPDLVTMDIVMPGNLNGIDTVAEIKKIDDNVKVLIISALGQELLVIEAIKAGAKDFVVKPFKQNKFLEGVKKVLGDWEE